jgi:peptidoglycan/xylan/chitin deacetylase (PgdA/CDA1 family)
MTTSAATKRTIDPITQMDHGWYRYSPIVDRLPLRWPNGERIAVWILPVVEFLDLLRPDTPGQHPPPGGPLDVRTWSHRDYGNRWGIWRVMDVLDKYRVRATVAVNALAARLYPDIVREARERDWEIVACGEAGSRVITSKMAVEDEKAMIERSRDEIWAATGTMPAGWLSPQVSESAATPALLAEAGFTYCADWANDDQPFDFMVPTGELTAVPYGREVDDQGRDLLGDAHRLGVGDDRSRPLRHALSTRGTDGNDHVHPLAPVLHRSTDANQVPRQSSRAHHRPRGRLACDRARDCSALARL